MSEKAWRYSEGFKKEVVAYYFIHGYLDAIALYMVTEQEIFEWSLIYKEHPPVVQSEHMNLV